jgi:hypothetical protein
MKLSGFRGLVLLLGLAVGLIVGCTGPRSSGGASQAPASAAPASAAPAASSGY